MAKKQEIKIHFETEKLKDEFIGWLFDGGGEQSFNMLEHIGDFSSKTYDGDIYLTLPKK